MQHEQIEDRLRAKYEAEEIDTGLYSAGVQYVVMDKVDDVLTFTWFECMHSIANL